ncbi:MAG: AarF/UbiB family protein [Myxococcota bacterium]
MSYSQPPPWYVSLPLGIIRFFEVTIFAVVLFIPLLVLPGRPRGFLLKFALATLGGAWQKLAQVLAQQPKLIGQHAAEYLSHLQDRGRKRANSVLMTRLKNAKGLDRSRLDLGETGDSVAAASCGAVYKAKWDGKPVAIKVVLTGARIAYTMDRALLRGVAAVVSITPWGRRMRLQDQLRKIADVYYMQLDLRDEGANTKLMFEDFAPPFNARLAARGSKLKIVIPEMHYCDRDVLIVDWVAGARATKVLADARDPDPAIQQACVTKWRGHGEVVIEAAVWASLRREVTHGDLHAGNVYFGEDSVIFLDFGLCSRIDDVHRLRLAAGLLSTAGGDAEGSRSLIGMAPTPPKLPPEKRAAFVAALHALIGEVNSKVGAGSGTEGLPLGTLLTSFLGVVRQHRVEPHPGFAVMNQNLLAAQGFVGALAPDYDLVSRIREEVIALYNDDAAALAHVKHVILLPSVVGLALRDEGVENLLVSALDLRRAFSPVSGADLDAQLSSADSQVHYLAPPDFEAYHQALLKLRFLRQRPAFKAKVQEMVNMMKLSPPHPMVQMTTVFLQNLVA